MGYLSTRQAAQALGLRPDALSRAVWIGKVDAPLKSPAGDYMWDEAAINRASWAILHREYKPQAAGVQHGS
jgi:hypothetical protein